MFLILVKSHNGSQFRGTFQYAVNKFFDNTMAKEKINLRKMLTLNDYFAIGVIVIGFFITIALSELVIRLIGISVTLLGGVALFLGVSKSLKDSVRSIYRPSVPPPKYTVTDIKGNDARRQVIEDFGTEFGNGESSTKSKSSEPIKELTQTGTPFDSDPDADFRIIGKQDKTEEKYIKQDLPKQVSPEPEPLTKPRPAVSLTEDDSEMRIIRKVKVDLPESDEPSKQAVKMRFGDDMEEPEIILPIAKQEIPSPAMADKEHLPEESLPALAMHEEEKEPEMMEPDIPPTSLIEDKLPYEDVQFSKKSPLKIEVEAVPDANISVRKELFPREAEKPTVHSGVIPQGKVTKDFKEKQLEFSYTSLVDEVQFSGQEPKKEFEYFLNRVLVLIRSITSTKTACFFLVNMEKKELILEAHVTDAPDAITTKNKLPLRNDVVSQIVINIKPEILSEINPAAEIDLIPYYTRPMGTSSFIGVPVFYNKSVIGIICADSSIPDAYDINTVQFLGHFTKLISGLVQSYTEKYELIQSSKTLNAINSFRKLLKTKNMTVSEISEAVVESASKIFDYSMLGLCCFDDHINTWKVFSHRAKAGEQAVNMKNFKVDINSTLIGKAITSGKTVFISPVKENHSRVHVRESQMKGGYFVAVPLKSLNNTYGALFVEGKSITSITQNDISILESLADSAGTSIEHLLFLDMFRNSSMMDTNTRMLNPPAFFARLEEEIIKLNELKSVFSVCLFQIDNYAALDPVQFRERNEKVYLHIVNIIKSRLKPYHIFGRADDNIFGIILVGMNIMDSHRLIERIRQEIARSFVEINKKRYNVTASFGLAEARRNEDMNEVLGNAKRTLDISVQKTNCVTPFE